MRTENQKEKDLVFSMRISYCLAVSILAHTQSHRRNCKAGVLVLLSLTYCCQDSLRHICRQKTNLQLENLTTFNSMCDMRTYYLSDSVQPSHLYGSVLLGFKGPIQKYPEIPDQTDNCMVTCLATREPIHLVMDHSWHQSETKTRTRF